MIVPVPAEQLPTSTGAPPAAGVQNAETVTRVGCAVTELIVIVNGMLEQPVSSDGCTQVGDDDPTRAAGTNVLWPSTVMRSCTNWPVVLLTSHGPVPLLPMTLTVPFMTTELVSCETDAADVNVSTTSSPRLICRAARQAAGTQYFGLGAAAASIRSGDLPLLLLLLLDRTACRRRMQRLVHQVDGCSVQRLLHVQLSCPVRVSASAVLLQQRLGSRRMQSLLLLVLLLLPQQIISLLMIFMQPMHGGGVCGLGNCAAGCAAVLLQLPGHPCQTVSCV